VATPGPTHRRGRWARIILSYGVGAACLFWVFHGIDFAEVLRSIRETHWLLLLPAIILNLLVYLCAGWEWQILLRPTAMLSVLRATQAVFAGRFANDVLPVHIGYVVRLYLVSRWTQTKVASILPSLLIERLFDGLWLTIGIGLTALVFPVPGKITRAAEIWGGLILFGVVALAVIVLRRWHPPAVPDRLGRSWKWLRKGRDLLAHVLDQVRAVSQSWFFLAALAISVLKLVVQALAFLLLLWAYGFHLPFVDQLAAFLIAYVGMAIPSTPASVGVFQFFCVTGLELFGVPKPVAIGFSLLAFVVLTVPLSVAGFLALSQSGVGLRQVRNEFAQGKMLEA
jgi:uncharacterized protein (TIRG00374 family)